MVQSPQQIKEMMANMKRLEQHGWHGFKSILEEVVLGESKGFRIIMMSQEQTNFYYDNLMFFVRNIQDFEKAYIEIGIIQEPENGEKQYHVTHQYIIDLEGNVTFNGDPCEQPLDQLGSNFNLIINEIKQQYV